MANFGSIFELDFPFYPFNRRMSRGMWGRLFVLKEFVMGKFPTGPTACLEEPSCTVRVTSLRDVGPIIVFCYWGFVFACLTSFFIYKWLRQRRHPLQTIIVKEKAVSAPAQESQLKAAANKQNGRVAGEDIRVSVPGESELHFTGYKRSVVGDFCYGLACLTSLQWLALIALVLVDYYNGCQVGGIDNLCFFGDNFIFGTYQFNGEIFFVVWWLTAFWFIFWVINKGRVHNFFRLPCGLPQASVVFAWAKDEKEILSVNVFFLVHLLRRIKAKLMPPATRGHFDLISIKKTNLGQRFFTYYGQRFLLDGENIDRAQLKVGDVLSDFHKGEKGLTVKEAESRLETIGRNEIPFKPEPFFFTVYDEMFSLFHTYQLLMYTLMFWNSYLFVGALLASIVVLSATITIFTRRRSQLVIAKITEYVTEANVLRNGSWSIIDSRLLVPGDIMKIKSDWLLPCDLVILHGSCVCNESSLTGESMPVQKYAAPNTATAYKPDGQGSRHTLFSGTTVLQAGSSIGDEVLAVVSATGMETSKGELLSGILFPEKTLFKYEEELPIVVTLLLAYAIVCFGISIYFQNHTGAQSIWVTKWIYCMAIINQILSPLLPVALEVGQVQAVVRLKGRGVFCLNPKRIAIAGKVRLFCFDKTGTLTKEGLDFIGTQSVFLSEGGKSSFEAIKSLEKGEVVGDRTLHGLATCHAVTKFGDQFVGNQVEVKMFSAVGWDLIEKRDEPPRVSKRAGSEEFSIVKRNEFDHARTTMSVIVQDSHGRFHAYCKGSFEKIRDLSSPDTIPENYMEVARSHALDGCYVLGMSHRILESGLSLKEALALSRDEVESDLEFVSLILFRNELKTETRGAIEDLKAGEVRSVMVTGDNAQCGHYVAKQSSLVAPQVQIILGDIQPDGRVGWSLMNTSGESKIFSTDELFKEHTKGLQGGILETAITGKAFNALSTTDIMEKLLFFTRIYARFTPADKVKVVDMHRARGLIVGMCGDGGNDCGALRAAHTGIALSEAEASVVSPFTSRDKSVVSVVDLLREGRGALHTSFACYKFLIMYGLMFSILKLFCYWYGIIPCQMDYIFIDGVAVLTLGYAMTLSYPAKKLGKIRPTSSLLGPLNVSSVVGVWIINLCFMVGLIGFMKNQSGYIPWPAKYSHGASWWTLGDNWESTVIWFTMYIQYITSAFVFTFGATFRRPVFANYGLTVVYVSLLAFVSVLLLLPHSGFTELWHVASQDFNKANPTSPVWVAYQKNGGRPSPAMPFLFRFRMWWILVVNVAVVIGWQKVVAEGPVSAALARLFPSNRPQFHF